MFFFPSVTFGLLSAEIFPWALIGSLIFFKSYSKNFFIVLCFFFVSGVLSLLIFGPTDAIRSIAAYINTLYAFAFMLTISQLELMKFIKNLKIVK